MAEIVWFRRGDGAEFAVQPDSDAAANLIAAGALHIEGPSTADESNVLGEAPTSTPTKAQLLERATNLKLDLPARSTNAEITAALAAEEQRLADESGTIAADVSSGTVPAAAPAGGTVLVDVLRADKG